MNTTAVFRSLPPRIMDPHMALRVINPARIEVKDAIVITVTSRWATCESSCAKTASSSSSSSCLRMPVVTTTTLRLGLRPVAKAFGTGLSEIPTLGFFMSAIAQIRSTIACTDGACSCVTSTARIAFIDSVSENHHWPKRNPPDSTSTKIALMPIAIRRPARIT